MKNLKQICLIILFSFLGEVGRQVIPYPIPASIYGMVLLFAALALKLIRVEQVKDAGSFLTSFLPVLFVAPLVSLMDCWSQMKAVIVPVAVIVVVSTVVVFAVSGLVTKWMMSRGGKKHG
ncbi:MAG: CidA/LrgA family protein [Oscillospiraceae bacterium]|nr:CidA/LrgA family protein [Oscillospiraceae bacterium]